MKKKKEKERNPEVVDKKAMKWRRKQKRSDCEIGGRKQESTKVEIKENEIRRGFRKRIKEFGN